MFRFFMIIVVFTLACASAAVFLVTIGVLSPLDVVGQWSQGSRLLGALAHVSPLERLVYASIALLCGVLLLVILLHQGSARRDPSTLHMLGSDDKGFVVIDSQGIASIASHAALSARGVVDVNVRVQGNGRSPVRLRVSIGVYPGADAKRAGEEAREAVADAVESLVGIKVRDVIVAIEVLQPDRLSRLVR